MRITHLIFLFIFSITINAQSYTGKVLDSSGKNLSSINIEIETSSKENFITQTNANGDFTFDIKPAQSFHIYIKEYGFYEFDETYTTNNLDSLILITLKSDETIQLKTVDLKKKKPLIKRKIDRLEFNVDETPLQNLSAWDILKNTPNVLLKNDQLSVRGNTQILVTINDKKVMMSKEELRQLLENTDGSTVSSVEVITNPPAKYEASGSAIINIKTKKNLLNGYKGQIYTRYHQSKYAKGMIGTSHAYNKNKWQMNGSYYFVNGKYYRSNYDVTTYQNSETRWESDMIRKTVAKEQHIYNFSSQYTIDSLQSVQFGFNGFNNPASIGNYNVPTKIFSTSTNHMESNYFTRNNRREYSNSTNAYFGYEKKFGKHSINWTNNFTQRRYKENQDVKTELNFINQPVKTNRFTNEAIQNLKLYSTQLDYSFTGNNYGFESGAKYSFVQNNNDLDFYEEINQKLEFQSDKSYIFDYKEQIFAAYLSGNYKWENWEAKAGFRSETTWIETLSNHQKNKQFRTKTDVFPSFYLMYTFANNAQLGINYGKRISRPNYNFLNPSKSYYNLFSYFQGDANAISTIIHNLNLTYTYKNWNFEAYYRYEKNPAMEISIQNNETFETVYNFTNIKNSEAVGINLSKQIDLKNWWKVNIFAMSEYNSNYYIGADQQQYKNEILFYNLNLNTQIDLNSDKTFSVSAGYFYNSKMIQASFDISSSQNMYVIINRKFWDKRLDIGLVFNDIFKTDRNTISTNYADQNQYFKDYQDTQYFMLNVKYNFGNQKVKEAKKVQQTEEQNRI